jgi:hypothetical protein
MTTAAIPTTTVRRAGSDRVPRLLCAASVIGAVAAFAMSQLRGDSGAEVTAGLVDDAVLLTAGSIIAALAASCLVLAAVRLGRAVGGDLGATLITSGAAVAVLFSAYYATFGAGAVVATQSLADPGAGLGESALLLLNLVEITRYAPTLVLAVAAVAARRMLPRPVWIAAAVIAVMTVLPFTSWVAALLAPVWLGASAATVRS